MIETLNSIADKWLDWEFAIAWQVGVLIAIIWVIDLLIRKWAWPQVRYALWLLVLVKLVLPPTLTSPASFTAVIPSLAQSSVKLQIEPLLTAPQVTQFVESVEPVEVGTNENVNYSIETGAEPITADFVAQSVEPDASAVVSLSWKVYAFFVWLAGIAFLASWLILRLTGLRREHLKSGQQSNLPDDFIELLKATANRLNLKKLPQVILTKKVCCPAVFGVFRPVLLMPSDKLKNLTRQDIEHILLHELAHIKRGDLLIHGVHMMLQIVFWFNPLLWLIRRQLQNLRELCCDATVARLLKEKTFCYRETLLETARQLLAEPVDPGLGLLGLFESSNRLVERLKWLERKTWKNRPLMLVSIFVLVALMFGCVLPMAKGEAQIDFKSLGITDALDVSDSKGHLTIQSIHVVGLDGKKLSSNNTTILVDVANNSDKEVYLGLGYYADSGTVALLFSPGVSSMAKVLKVRPNWQGQLEFPMNYNRFSNGGYVKITLARCSSDSIEGISLPQRAEVIHDKQYGIISVGQQKQVVKLLNTLRTAKGRQRLRAAEQLAKYGRSVVPAIADMLEDDNVWAAHALRLIGPESEDAVPALIKSLTQGGVGGVRGFSAIALGQIGSAAVQAIPALVKTLKDEHANTRMHAAEALGYLSTGEKYVVDSLMASLQDEDETVRKAASRSLKQIEEKKISTESGKDAGDLDFLAKLPNGFANSETSTANSKSSSPQDAGEMEGVLQLEDLLAKMIASRSKAENLQFIAEYHIKDTVSGKARTEQMKKEMEKRGLSKQQIQMMTKGLSEVPKSRFQILKCTVDNLGHAKIERTSGSYSNGNKVFSGDLNISSWDGKSGVDFNQRKGFPGYATIKDVAPTGASRQGHPWRTFTGTFINALRKAIDSGTQITVNKVEDFYDVIIEGDTLKHVGIIKPSKGYNCIMEEFHRNGQLSHRRVAQYKEIENGIWFPICGEMKSYLNDGSQRSISTVTSEDIKVNEPGFNITFFEVDFPEGTEVQDNIQGKKYVVGSDKIYELDESEPTTKTDAKNVDDNVTAIEKKASEAGPDNWRTGFDAVYRLEDGEVLKWNAPPFIPERKNFFLNQPGRTSSNVPYDYVLRYVFHWNGKLNRPGMLSGIGISRLDSVLESVIGLGIFEFQGPDELLHLPMPGDWIVRKGGAKKELLAALEKIIWEDTEREVRFEKRTVEEDVIVVKGEYQFKPLESLPQSQSVHISANSLDDNAGSGGGSGTLERFLKWVGNRVNMKLVDQTESTDFKMSWRNHYSSRMNKLEHNEAYDVKLQLLLNNLKQQTGLTFKRQTGIVEKWFVVEDGKTNNTNGMIEINKSAEPIEVTDVSGRGFGTVIGKANELSSIDMDMQVDAAKALRHMSLSDLIDMLGDDTEFPEMVLMISSLSSMTQSCSSEYTFGSEAAEAIARIGKKSDRLITLLESDDWRVRADATRAVGGLKDSRATDTLIAFVQDLNEHTYVRGNAVLALRLLNDDRAVAALIGAADDEEAVIRRSVASVLGDFGGSQIVEPLMSLVTDSDAQVRIGAVGGLGDVKESDVIPALLKALADENRQVREVAAGVLSRQPDPRSLQPLIEALGDSYPNTRARAAQTLGNLKDSRVFEPLIDALKDDNEYVRWHAATALGELKDRRAVEPLIAVAMNDGHMARTMAIGALGKLGGSRAVDALVEILQDDESVFRMRACDALRKITGQTFPAEYDAWKDWPEMNRGTLSCGVTVELLGLCEYPNEGKQWWKPDGQLVETTVEIDINVESVSPIKSDEQAVLFKLKYYNDNGKITFVPRIDNNSYLFWNCSKNVILTKLPKSQTTSDLRLKVSAGQWKTIAYGGSGKTNAYTANSFNDSDVIFYPLENNNGKVTVRIANQLGQIVDCRAVVYDKTNTMHEPESSSNTGREISSCEGVFNIPQENIASIALQYRPFETIIFKNVSLKPDLKTDVEVLANEAIASVPFPEGNTDDVAIVKD